MDQAALTPEERAEIDRFAAARATAQETS
jgi:hypothetical protein